MNSDDAFCIKIGILNLFWIDCNQFPKQLKYNLDDLIHPGAIIKFFCYYVSWFCKATAHCLAFRIVSDGRNGPKVQMERQTDRQEAVECRRPAGLVVAEPGAWLGIAYHRHHIHHCKNPWGTQKSIQGNISNNTCLGCKTSWGRSARPDTRNDTPQSRRFARSPAKKNTKFRSDQCI